ncbi:hypothetical protein AB0M47_32250 [Hamadaea sp. NPDC051192]|uniref:hypothetical protein n=1 Tax=Hamadaea sp. NPDC051192 TaxID=3154940 RepID=UPI00341ECC46
MLLATAASSAGCVSYDPQPASHPAPPIVPGYSTAPATSSSAASPMPSSTWTPAVATTYNTAPTWSKIDTTGVGIDFCRPEPFRITLWAVDEDDYLGDVRVTVTFDGGSAFRGAFDLTFDDYKFVGTLPDPVGRVKPGTTIKLVFTLDDGHDHGGRVRPPYEMRLRTEQSEPGCRGRPSALDQGGR